MYDTPTEARQRFFGATAFATIEALCERIFPADASGPGARDLGAANYIDSAVAENDVDLQDFYLRGIEELDEWSRALHGAPFAYLADEAADALLERIERREFDDPAVGARLESFFGVVWEHTIQGLFCDPEYGGNRDGGGWRLIGFPGARWGYDAEQMREGFDSKDIPIVSLADLRDQIQAMRANEATEGTRA